MDTFQITILVVAAILLIAIFTTVGILTKYSTADKVFPPMANTCPDYWTVDASGNCVLPPNSSSLNAGKIYGSSDSTLLSSDKDESGKIYTPGYMSGDGKINFNDPLWSTIGKSPICAKKSWANTNTIAWDGVSNYNSCE